jgi:hypothetical protein
MPAQPTPPNPIGLQNSFDQFVEAFNKGQFNSESKPGLNDLVAEQAAFTHIHSDRYETNGLAYFDKILPGPQIRIVTRTVYGWSVYGRGTWTDPHREETDDLFFTFAYAEGRDGSPWIVAMSARIEQNAERAKTVNIYINT